MASRRKKPSLAEKIGNFVTAAPTIFSSDDENEQTKAKVVEAYDEADVSDVDHSASIIRRRNVDLLDEVDDRYKGKKVSRRDVYESENESDNESTIEDESLGSNDSNSKNESSEEDAEMASDGDGSDSDTAEDSEIDEDNPLRRDRGGEADFKSVTQTNMRGDIEKGNCVREQLKIWESLLETRIKLQKCLIASNKMPQQEVYRQMKEDKNFRKGVTESTNKLSGLLENLLDLQANLLKNHPETRDLSKTGGKQNAAKPIGDEDSDEEICSDTEEEKDPQEDSQKVVPSEEAEEKKEEKEETLPCKKRIKRSLTEYENLLAANHEMYRGYRNSVIQKWNDKTRVASGSLNKSSSQTIVKQIEFVLGDREKLLKKTRLKRSEYEILGKEQTAHIENGRRQQDCDSEIYDDDDFYHQLLRELIEYKSSDITDPVQLSKQWISLQNMRNKMKRKIDTRATKGRRIRYNVHTKLVNFMAPVTVNDTWFDLAKNELYNSLFGKIKASGIEASADGKSSDK